MSVVKGNPNFDFMEQNPVVCTMSSFKKVYTKYKKEEASKLCWAMWMIEEPDVDENIYARIASKEDRVKEVQSSYYKIDTESEEYKGIASDFTELLLSREEKLYSTHVIKLEELTVFLKTLDITNDKDFDKYFKIMDKMEKMWKTLDLVKDKMIESKSKSKIRGGAQLSVREKRK